MKTMYLIEITEVREVDKNELDALMTDYVLDRSGDYDYKIEILQKTNRKGEWSIGNMLFRK